MSSREYKLFFDGDVDGATQEILEYLHVHNKVIYFDGWHGVGACTVLKNIAEVLPSRRTARAVSFDRIFFIDCSDWKSRRATQRAIVEELKLDSSVIAILDKQDEEDDFNGVDHCSRDVIRSVAAVIDKTLMSERFMMIFLNGSSDEVDVTRFGIPQFTDFRNNTMIWTFKRRFMTMHPDEVYSEMKRNMKYTDAFLSYSDNNDLTSAEFQAILLEEANTIAAHNPCVLDRTMVAHCCLYELFLHYNFHTSTKFDWASHASNYWICDGIIQGAKAKDIGNSLHQDINWKCDASFLHVTLKQFMKHLKPPFLVVKGADVYEDGPYRWISITSRDKEVCGMQTIPATTSSFFLAFETSSDPQSLPNGLFEHSNKLGVLVLCSCAFNFASPPFRKCHGLRFLGLDHCTHSETAEIENDTDWTFLYSLMVLDLRHTKWNEIFSGEQIEVMKNIRELNIEGVRCWEYYATQLQGRLPYLERLRIIRPICPWETSGDVDDSFTDKTSMEILDLSGNSNMENLPTSLSKASGLQMLILDACDGLENIVALGHLPPSLKSISFDGYGCTSQRTPTVELPPKHSRPSSAQDNKDISTSKISLEGCIELDNLFLRGLNNLVELDLSGTAINVLDFNTMVVQVPRLKRLFLIGCKHLRAIIPDEGTRLELMCVDTRARIMCPRPSIGTNKCVGLQVHAIVVDARLTRSLIRYIGWGNHNIFSIHVTSSPVYDGVEKFEETDNDKFSDCDQGRLQQLIPVGQYSDVLSSVGNPPMQAFPQPPATHLDRHIEIGQGSCYIESELVGTVGMLMHRAESLHLHHVLIHAFTPMSPYPVWSHLRWCRVERCPNLDTVFTYLGLRDEFLRLETFWASDLLMARWIWGIGIAQYGHMPIFANLQHLHLRSCPSLQSVVPAWISCFPILKTLHIIHCGDLVHIFRLDGLHPKEIFSVGVLFPKLTTIHLHDLPKLHQICEVKMVAPALETIKIRGCWGLRRLPSVGARPRGAKKPAIEIEKDVWDALEWDADHRPDHFEAPIHSRYYKKKLPRVSFLR